MYRISIIIPVYNAEDSLEEAFNSILNQTFDFNDLEIIFVDDNSSDDSAEIINKFAQDYPNVKSIFLEQNSGFPGRPRNVGIEHSTAPYLMFLDADDTYFENACELLYANITENDLDMVSGNYVRCVGDIVQPKYWDNIDLVDNEITVEKIEDQPNLFSVSPAVWCKIFRKSFILENNIRFGEDMPAQDVHFVYNAILKAKGIKYIDIPVVKYYPGYGNNMSMTSNRSKKNLLNFIYAYNRILELFKEYPEYERFIVSHLNFLTSNLILSEISTKDKMDLLIEAYDLYHIQEKNDLKPLNHRFIPFYEKVYVKDFIGAISLCDELSLYLTDNDFKICEENKTRNIIIISDEKIYDLFEGSEYSAKLINLDEECDSDHAINIYKYYSNNLTVADDYVKLDCNDFSLYFDNISEFHDYFITEIVLQSHEKPFLIGNEEDISNINSKIAFKVIKPKEDYELNDFEDLFKKCYLKEAKDTFEIPKKLENENIKLHNENQRLKESNSKLKEQKNNLKEKNSKLKEQKSNLKEKNSKLKEQKGKLKEKNSKLKESRDYYKNLVGEITSSKSWKITKPLRKIMRVFKKN